MALLIICARERPDATPVTFTRVSAIAPRDSPRIQWSPRPTEFWVSRVPALSPVTRQSRRYTCTHTCTHTRCNARTAPPRATRSLVAQVSLNPRMAAATDFVRIKNGILKLQINFCGNPRFSLPPAALTRKQPPRRFAV